MQVHWARDLFLLVGYSLRGLIAKLTFRQRPWGKWIWSGVSQNSHKEFQITWAKKKKKSTLESNKSWVTGTWKCFLFFPFQLEFFFLLSNPWHYLGTVAHPLPPTPLTGMGWWNPENSECDLGVWHSQIVRKSTQELNRWEGVLASGMLLLHFYWRSLWFTDLIQF